MPEDKSPGATKTRASLGPQTWREALWRASADSLRSPDLDPAPAIFFPYPNLLRAPTKPLPKTITRLSHTKHLPAPDTALHSGPSTTQHRTTGLDTTATMATFPTLKCGMHPSPHRRPIAAPRGPVQRNTDSC